MTSVITKAASLALHKACLLEQKLYLEPDTSNESTMTSLFIEAYLGGSFEAGCRLVRYYIRAGRPDVTFDIDNKKVTIKMLIYHAASFGYVEAVNVIIEMYANNDDKRLKYRKYKYDMTMEPLDMSAFFEDLLICGRYTEYFTVAASLLTETRCLHSYFRHPPGSCPGVCGRCDNLTGVVDTTQHGEICIVCLHDLCVPEMVRIEDLSDGLCMR